MNPNVTVIQPTITVEQEQKIRVAAYCRVSSDSADQLNSFMAQMRYYENFLADSKTETLVSVYADEGVTGTRIDKREDFQRMLKDCRRGKIDRIIAKSISRFARNTKECLTVLRELKSLGITVLFEKENIDTANISDEMMITLMGGLAQEESVSISQNMRWANRKRMADGSYKIACPPYGFSICNGRLEINETEAKIVRNIFTWYLNGCGITKIANMLNELKIPSSISKSVWSFFSVKYILKNERYIGDAVFQKTYIVNQLESQQELRYNKRMSYSKDLRERVVKYRLDGHTLKETSRVFCVGQSAIGEWVKKYKETGDLSNKPLNRSFKKIDPEKLKAYIAEHPDAYQKEVAEVFGCSATAIGKALKRLGITRKKRQNAIANKRKHK